MAVTKRKLRKINRVPLYIFILIYYQKHSEKIERNLKERKFALGKIQFSRKIKEMLLVCLVVHAFVSLYLIS